MKKFTSATDKVYLWIITAAVMVIFVPTLFIIYQSGNPAAVYINLFVIIIVSVLVSFTFAIEFIQEESEFIAKWGPFKIKVDLKNVVKVTDKYSIYITPAIIKIGRARNALSIRYKKGDSIMLRWLTFSIVEEKEFIKEVLRYSPNAEIELKRVKLN